MQAAIKRFLVKVQCQKALNVAGKIVFRDRRVLGWFNLKKIQRDKPHLAEVMGATLNQLTKIKIQTLNMTFGL